MAIIDNRTTQDGDVLIIKPEIPIVGLISLYDFVDTTTGENYPTDYYKKEFRYSINGGLTFSSWLDLTTINISNVDIRKQDQFVIEYRYTHVGSTPSVELEFDDILVSGNVSDLDYPIYNSTFFKNFFNVNDINVYGWALNVLEKLYLYGILPKYMTRGEQSDNVLEDRDFINFWNSVTHYFAIIVYYARQFRDITQYPDIVEIFLQNRGIEVGSVTISQIVELFNNYIQQYGARGTNKIIEQGTINGEFLRMIDFISPEEFIFALLQNFETGWCIGKSSPCWNNTENITNVIKGYEYTKEVKSLSKYPLLNSSFISIDGDDMKIDSVTNGSSSGIDYDSDETKKIVINKNLDYEISFFCKLNQAGTKLIFGVRSYDANGNALDLLNAVDGVASNTFFSGQVLKVVGKYYWIRGIIYNQNKTNDPDALFIPNGHYLRFNSATEVKYIVPQVLLDNTSNVSPNGLSLTNIKVRPLKTPFTRGQLGMKNIILSYLKNNNKTYTIDKMEGLMKSQLIPANSFLKIKYL